MARASKGTRVTPAEIAKMVELYEQLGSYKAVAERLRRNPQTVARHIQAGKTLVVTEVNPNRVIY